MAAYILLCHSFQDRRGPTGVVPAMAVQPPLIEDVSGSTHNFPPLSVANVNPKNRRFCGKQPQATRVSDAQKTSCLPADLELSVSAAPLTGKQPPPLGAVRWA